MAATQRATPGAASASQATARPSVQPHLDRQPQPHLDREAAQRVLRRAVELVDLSAGSTPDGVSVTALLEAADELGIDGGDVLRAVAEERLGLLDPGRTRGDRVVGPAAVVATRVVDLPPAQALERVDAWVRRDALRRTRSQADWAEYRKRSDPIASLQRTARSLQGDRQLDRVGRLRVVVSDLSGGRTLVGLVVDAQLGRSLTTAAVGTSAAGTVVGASAAAVTVLTDLALWPGWMWLAVPATAAGGVGVVAARRAWVNDARHELDALLDLVASGPPPPGVLGSLGTLRHPVRSVRRG